jgi:hypothetical protein
VQVSGNTAAAVFVWFTPLFWPYFLLQCGVGYFRVYAMINGLWGSEKTKGWKVGPVCCCAWHCCGLHLLDLTSGWCAHLQPLLFRACCVC